MITIKDMGMLTPHFGVSGSGAPVCGLLGLDLKSAPNYGPISQNRK